MCIETVCTDMMMMGCVCVQASAQGDGYRVLTLALVGDFFEDPPTLLDSTELGHIYA